MDVVEGVHSILIMESAIMIAFGPLLVVFSIGIFCWLLLALGVYALPFLAGVMAGLAAFNDGAGVAGGIAFGFFVGPATLYAGQLAFASARSPLIRAMIALLFAVPATLAGYHVAHGLAQFDVPSGGWRQIFAIFGAALLGATAWARMFQPDPFAVGPARLGSSVISRFGRKV